MRESRTTVEDFSGAAPAERAIPAAVGGAVVDEAALRRPRSAVEILDLSFDILRERFASIVLLCAVLWLPVAIVQTSAAASMSTAFDPEVFFESLFGSLVASVLGMLVQVLASALVALLVMAAINGERLTLREACVRTLRRAPGIVALAILVILLSIPAYLACLVPLLFVAWKTSIAATVYVVERTSIGASFSRSFALTRGTFLRWLCIASLTYLFEMSVGALSTMAQIPDVRDAVARLGVPLLLADALLVIFSSFFMGVAISISSVARTVFYDDCRLRSEGTDLAQRLERLRLEPAS